MSSPLSTPPIAPPATGNPVRRHHTITATSRPPRSTASVITEEPQDWDENDAIVAEDWHGTTIGNQPIRSIHDHKPLQRQASLPSGYNRELRNVRAAEHTANRVNSLSAIEAEHGVDENAGQEDWEREMYNVQQRQLPQQSPPVARPSVHRTRTASYLPSPSESPLSPVFPQNNAPSPPPASGAIRRHQSLTYGATSGGSKLARSATGGKRAGGRHGTGALALGVAVPRTASPVDDADEDQWDQPQDEDDTPPSPLMRAIWQDGQGPFGRSGRANQEWRDESVNEISRALGALEMPSHHSPIPMMPGLPPAGSFYVPQMPEQQVRVASNGYRMNHPVQTSTNPPPPPVRQTPIPPSSTPPRFGGSPSIPGHGATSYEQQLEDPYLAGEFNQFSNPISTSMQPGGARHRNTAPSPQIEAFNPAPTPSIRSNTTPTPGRANSMPQWDPSSGNRGGLIGEESFANVPNAYQNQHAALLNYHNQMYNNQFVDPGIHLGPSSSTGSNGSMGLPYAPSSAFFGNGIGNGTGIQQIQQGRGGMMGRGGAAGASPNINPLDIGMQQQQSSTVGDAASSLDLAGLVAAKGYNPTTFDTRPQYAKYFVIKSYTEDDVHKSLKYEIWSSTDPGNKRLDKAFRECAGRGPIYLFFSVNASGHFCGVAEMLTPVDYTRSSTVWAQDKWKGVFKVRWIFVRDVPNAMLRGIRLENTPERKPVTNSRDTQELLPDVGSEMLRIFLTHQARTSLLQDFHYYERQAAQKELQDQQMQQMQQAQRQQQQAQYASQIAQSQLLNQLTAQQQQPQLSPRIGQGQGQWPGSSSSQQSAGLGGQQQGSHGGRPFPQRSPSYPNSNASGGY